jgi:hypothetical protein
MSHSNPKGVPLLDVGRDVHGRFRKANPGGPGNPFARKVAALRKAVLDSVSEQDVKDMVESLKQQARQGDKAAIKLLLQYCVGKPAPPNDPDRMDADEWRRLQEMRVGHQQLRKTIESVPACLACHVAQTYWPCDVQDGPLAETVHDVHAQLQASGPARATTPDAARPDAAPAQAAASGNQKGEPKPPTEPAGRTAQTRPSSANRITKSSERHEPAGGPGNDSRSLTQPPSPNGGNGQERRQAPERPQPLRQPPQPPEQTQPEPPRG